MISGSDGDVSALILLNNSPKFVLLAVNILRSRQEKRGGV